jgi:hypothetical protein
MGAFDNFTPPAASSGGAFDNFIPPATAHEPGAPDWLPGAVWLNHMTRVLDDSLTFGQADRLGDLPGTGTNLAAERAKTAAASQAVGPVASAAANIAGYTAGAGELGGAAKIGEAAAPYLAKLPLTGSGKWLGGVLGSGAEGAIAGGAGALGHGDSASDAENAALWSGALGAGGGSLGGVVGRGNAPPPGRSVGNVLPTAPTADALSAAAKQAYAPLSNVLYDATKEVHPSIDPIDAQNALRDWSGYKWNDAAKTKGEINTLLNKPQLSANDLQQSQSYLKGVAGDGRSDPNDAMYAAHYAGKLQDVLDNATPFTGVPQNWANPTNAPSFASARKAAGDALYGKAQDVGRLDDWIAKSAVPQGPDVGSQASQYLRTGAGQTFAAPGSPGYDALSTLAKTSAAPDIAAAPSAWDLRHMAHPLVGAGLGAALGVGSEHELDPAHIAEAALGGAALGYGFHKGVPAVQGAFNAARQQRAIDAARVALGTGMQQSPLGMAAPFRDAVRKLIFGQAAAGQ